MTLPSFLAALVVLGTASPALSPAVCQTPDGPTAAPSDSLRAIFDEGVPFEVFLHRADERTELWHRVWTEGRVPATVLERVRAVVGSPRSEREGTEADYSTEEVAKWRLVVVAVAGCSDSVHSVPYLARLALKVDGLELRVVTPEAGQSVLKAHRTPDGRGATPTAVLLDREDRLAGCWVEQPRALQEWWLGEARELSADRRMELKMSWYDEDAGSEVLREMVQILEAAHGGELICPGSD